MEYMFFVTSGGVVGIHRFGVPVSATAPATAGHYYCLKISAAGRVTVEESIDGISWVVLYVYPQAAAGGYYAQFALYNNFAHLQYPETLNFAPVTVSSATNTSSPTWAVAAFDLFTAGTSYATGTASTTGGNTFNNNGVNSVTGRAASTEARMGFRYTAAGNRNALVGFDERNTAAIGAAAMRYGAYVDGGGTNSLIIINAGVGLDTGYVAILGQYYALHITAAGVVSVEESSDNTNWVERYRFASTFTGVTYAHFSLFGSANTLSSLQSQGLGAAAGGSTPPTDPTLATFTTDPTVVYDGAGNYTTNSSTGGWSHTVMGTKTLAASQEGIIHLLFKGDGTDGLSIIGLHDSANKYSSFNIYAGIYIEPKGAGAYGLRMLGGTDVNNTFGIDPLTAGTRYGVQRKTDGTINVVSNSGSGWVVVRQLDPGPNGSNPRSFTGAMTAGLSVLANGSDVNVPNSKAYDVRQTW